MFSLSSPEWVCVPARVCVLAFTDSSGIRHSVEVAAESLYEAAALALKAFCAANLVDDLSPGRATILTIAVKSPATEHAVLCIAFSNGWLHMAAPRRSRSPRSG